ncbi:hypothetical protein LVJ94_34600 [Pendulispora rubella]|uniref:DUF2188 domain-containing protein n=1 Tax=Pendulispora rubella TaxID=2741070 RepID=A0ABZ2KU02_9BACT
MAEKTAVDITLDEADTRTWESGGPEGEALRKAIRARARAVGGHVEIYAHDGITLDAIDTPEDDACYEDS